MRAKNSIRYYLLILLVLAFSFFTNDFGLIDIQKTALVIAVGIDRENDEFIVTSQIALPKPDAQGEQNTEIVSKSKTVANAFEKINAKTGWYPKLVFCQLIILGENAVQSNVFESLGFFLRNEYISDSCLLATCQGSAQELLNAKNPVENLSGLAIVKMLSSHAKEVGTVLPTTLREFSQRYYSEHKSGYLPVIKTEKPQEDTKQSKQKKGKTNGQVRDERKFFIVPTTSQDNSSNSSQEKNGSQSGKSGADEEKVFSASETALFKNGSLVGKLTKEETLALAFVKSKLRLAVYLIGNEGEEHTLSVRQNSPKTKLSLADKNQPRFEIKVTATVAALDKNRANTMEELEKSPEVPKNILQSAEEKLEKELFQLFKKTKALDCDVFDCVETLKRKEYDEYSKQKDTLLERITPDVEVSFRTVR
ncbi:MAG: hypothetical protein IKA72_00320 [Clostridia bacterium]|nr:hypothetical protein [Clostridia bacterium]